MSSEISQEPRQSDFFNICETCTRGCCNGTRPPLTSKRKRIIQDFLKAHGILLFKPFENREYVFPRETKDGYCVFFVKATRKCQVHPVKPETCVAGPITFDINWEHEKIEWFMKSEKICPLASALYGDKDFFEKHSKSAKSEVLRLVNELDSEALRAILTIDEPDTFKIGEDILHSKVVVKLRQ